MRSVDVSEVGCGGGDMVPVKGGNGILEGLGVRRVFQRLERGLRVELSLFMSVFSDHCQRRVSEGRRNAQSLDGAESQATAPQCEMR